MMYPPSLAFEASIPGDGDESYDQDHQGTMHNASRSINQNISRNAKTPPVACRISGGSQTASDGCLFFFISAKEFESLLFPEKPRKTFLHLWKRYFRITLPVFGKLDSFLRFWLVLLQNTRKSHTKVWLFLLHLFHQHRLVREAGLEPARAYCTLEPESSESANSTTRALFAPERFSSGARIIISRGRGKVKRFSRLFYLVPKIRSPASPRPGTM